MLARVLKRVVSAALKPPTMMVMKVQTRSFTDKTEPVKIEACGDDLDEDDLVVDLLTQ